MRWSEKETLEFVKIYLRHQCLWNPDDDNYKLRFRRQKAFSDIVAELKVTTGIALDESEVKIKIKNLRSTYAQELAKIRLRSSSDSIYKPTIKWFSEWHKCFNGIIKRRSFPNIEGDAQEQDDEIWILQQSDNENEGTEDIDPFVTQTDEAYHQIFKNESKDSHMQSYKQKKKLRHENISADNSDISYRSSTESDAHLSEDEFDIYGKYIASQLRNMDLQKALRVQLEIQNIVSQARISSLNGF
ncbi:uncharacterized protein LOC128675681 [Plodia interpunctella]|uniref:uncharacterized protein LOC128675681 n=1 Tax=Plodia interpunctella TaxID=58824 RepID=UPI0023675C5C|nr:uncharacterized protein LOC128675681 [Plodia interpunctella]